MTCHDYLYIVRNVTVVFLSNRQIQLHRVDQAYLDYVRYAKVRCETEYVGLLIV